VILTQRYYTSKLHWNSGQAKYSVGQFSRGCNAEAWASMRTALVAEVGSLLTLRKAH